MAVTIKKLVAPPVAGDLVIRPLSPGQEAPAGWTEAGQGDERRCWRVVSNSDEWRPGDLLVERPAPLTEDGTGVKWRPEQAP